MSPPPIGRWLLVAAAVIVLATVVAAIVSMGTPNAQRDARLDMRRIRDLDRIAGALDAYYRSRGQLPPDLASLERQPGQRLAIVDPVTGAPYGYQVTGERRVRLCAVFVTDTAESELEPRIGDRWMHGVGLHCFDRKVRKDKDSGRSDD